MSNSYTVLLLIVSFDDNIPDKISPVRYLMAFDFSVHEVVELSHFNNFVMFTGSFEVDTAELQLREETRRGLLVYIVVGKILGNWQVIGRFHLRENQLGEDSGNL